MKKVITVKIKEETNNSVCQNGTYNKNELKNCPIGAIITLVFDDEDEYTGILRGITSEDAIMLESESNKQNTIELPYSKLNYWALLYQADKK